MDLQSVLDNAVKSMRAEVLKTSPQLTIGELVLKLENRDPSALVYFDFDNSYPLELTSWRGSYCEIAFEYESGNAAPTVSDVIRELKAAIGKTYQGYKGGDFVMGKHTPIWVDHYGMGGHRGVIDIKSDGDKVIIQTADCDY